MFEELFCRDQDVLNQDDRTIIKDMENQLHLF